MTKSTYDVIVVGGGHNGLICATYLAQSGKKVLVLEANASSGGAAATTEFSSGFSVSSCAQWLMQLNPDVSKEINPKKHGMKLLAKNLKTIALSKDGNNIVFNGKNISGAGISDKDKQSYVRFYKRMQKFSKLFSGAFKRRPPKIVENNLTDRLTLLKLGIDMKLLGKNDMREFIRIILMNIYDVMEENFDNEHLKGAISLDGIMGSHMGPRSPNTVFGYLYRHLSDVFGFKGPSVVKGGMGAVGQALANAATSAGVEIRYNSMVKSIVTVAGVATAVELTEAETIAAKTIVSSADPKVTFEKLIGYKNVETGVVRNVHNIRMKGNTAKLHLALDGLPAFAGVSEKELGNRLIIAPSMNYLEKAFNHAKYDEFSSAPAMDISIPTIHDKSLAPEGKHVLSAIVQFAPYDLKEGWNDETKETFKQLLIDCLADYAPGINNLIIESELLTPVDLESRHHITGGHWHHGELALDQVLMMRPFPGATQYGTPVDGLFLCGAGSHPGGGVMGLAGRNAAKEIIKRGETS